MGTLRIGILTAAFLWAAPSAAGPVERWTPFIEEAAVRFRIPEAWIRQVMAAESGGLTMLHGRPIESSAGALGLMQLMPGTWHDLRALHRLGTDPHDPRDNILAGAAYLRAMHERFGYPGLFAAYNAGPARYARHRATGRRLPAETIAYVARVGTRLVDPGGGTGQAETADPLFVALASDGASHRVDPSAVHSARPRDLCPPARGCVRRAVTPAAAFAGWSVTRTDGRRATFSSVAHRRIGWDPEGRERRRAHCMELGKEQPMVILVEIGCYSLNLTVEPGADLDSAFRAICNDTGEILIVNGWLADSIIVE